jgi:AcrR family transcriptional regulator
VIETLTGTKEIIFDKALEIIATIGFENMTIRDLADEVGLKGASIYNHFSSKQEILDCIYDYYCEHHFDARTPIEKSKRIIETGTREEIYTKALTFDFVRDDEKMFKRMVLTAKIVMMRLFNDQRANQIFFEYSNEKAHSYVKEILEYGISIGRIENFDIDTYINFLIGMIYYTGIKAFARPDYIVKKLDEETNIAKMLMNILPLKNE